MRTRLTQGAAFLVIAGVAGIASAAVSPIAATGYTHDYVLNGAGPYNLSVTGTMDGGPTSVENWTWVEAGTYTNPSGAPQVYKGLTAGTQTSLTGNGTFAFQPFTGNNVVELEGAETKSLTLTTPGQYTKIALYGAAGNGAKTATVTMHFTDGSTTAFNVASGTGIGTDWFNSNADKALVVGGRSSNKSEEGYTRLFYQENAAISINESLFTLSPADSLKSLSSVDINNTGGNRMVVFAISGEVTPEPATLTAVAATGLLASVRRRRR